MEIKAGIKTITNQPNATVVIDPEDRLSVAFKDGAGMYQVVNVRIASYGLVIKHEQTGDTMVVGRDGTIHLPKGE